MAQPLLTKEQSFSFHKEGLRNTKVLIVDDNYLLAHLIQLMLEDEGYEARAAGDGREGYFSYLLFRPDVVITDLHMPGKNGLELMENIRRHDPKVKTIYMSGEPWLFWSRLEEEKTGYPVSILQKPFSKVELMRLLSEPGG